MEYVTEDRARARQKDEIFKKIISDTSILAEIAKEVVDGYSDVSIEDVRRYVNIEGNPSVIKLDSESINSNGCRTVYDSKFRMQVPDRETFFHVYLEIEGQGTDRTPYPIENRQQFYLATMISDQKGHDFTDQHYEGLRRCYSVWVVMRPSRKDRNSIYRYTLEPEALLGNVDNARRMDLMNLFVVNLGDPNEQTDVRMMQIMNAIFSEGMDDETRDRILSEKYDIHLDLGLAREAREMSFEEEYDMLVGYGHSQGYAKGKEEGIAQGSRDTCVHSVLTLVKKMDIGIEEAMDLLDIPESSRDSVRAAIDQKSLSS